MKVIAEENICKITNEIESLNKKIQNAKLDLYKPQEESTNCRKEYKKVIDEYYVNLNRIQASNAKKLYHPISCKKNLDEAHNKVIELEKSYKEDKENSYQLARELDEARNQIARLKKFYNKAIVDAEPIKRELNEVRKQVKKTEIIREEKIASIEKLVCTHKNAIADSEKRIAELIEVRSSHQKHSNILDNVIRLTTNRSYLLFIIFLLNSFANQNKKDDIWNSYRCLVLRDARRLGQIPAWEGIRIVKERVQE